mmetsp:Transcript_191/g.215  ORF Transcript_191/g.215 Transcript_191/m.215 type:complete len:351 (-) Transcript_191:70-1122(-)
MGAGASVPEEIACILPAPENGGAISSSTGAIFVVDIISGRGFSKLTSTCDRDVIDPFVYVKVNELPSEKTDAKENETKPFFNQRFIFLIPQDQIEGGSVRFTLMDKDTMTTDDNMAVVKMDLPPSNIPTMERLNLVPNQTLGMNSEAEPKLDIGCILIPVSDMLKAPVLIEELNGQISALKSDDEADEAMKADLLAQIEDMVIDDADDEAQKADMMEKLNTLSAEMEAAKQAEAEVVAAHEAAVQAMKDDMASKEAELNTAQEEALSSLASAENSEEAQKKHIETITALLNQTKDQLKESRDQNVNAQNRIRELECQVGQQQASSEKENANKNKNKLKMDLMGKKKKKKK